MCACVRVEWEVCLHMSMCWVYLCVCVGGGGCMCMCPYVHINQGIRQMENFLFFQDIWYKRCWSSINIFYFRPRTCFYLSLPECRRKVASILIHLLEIKWITLSRKKMKKIKYLSLVFITCDLNFTRDMNFTSGLF